MARTTAHKIFLQAFDKTIDQVCQRLASRGLTDDAIWTAFRKAAITMRRLALDVEDEQLARRILKKDDRVRRSAAGGCRKSRAHSRLSCRRNNGYPA